MWECRSTASLLEADSIPGLTAGAMTSHPMPAKRTSFSEPIIDQQATIALLIPFLTIPTIEQSMSVN
jgi:hypothetical protein